MRAVRQRRILRILGVLLLLGALTVAALNVLVLSNARGRILSASEVAGTYDCILVLGSGVREDGTPSAMLADRLQTGCALYEAGAAPLLLMSGDRHGEDYDEVGAMEAFALQAGVPEAAIQKDGEGYSTYESFLNLYRLLGADCRVLIVSQRYHLSRALWIADSFGMEAVGVATEAHSFSHQTYRNIREVAARVKDVLLCLVPKK